MTTDSDGDGDNGGGEGGQEPVMQRWVCLGRRWVAGRKRLYTVWRSTADGTDRYYAGLPGVVGGQYEVTVSRDGDSRTVHGTPVFTDRADPPDDEVGAWEVADRAAYAAHRAHALQASAKRSSEVDTALVPLLRIAARLTSYADRDALVRYVTAKVHTAKPPR
jgi:hypothetical protein